MAYLLARGSDTDATSNTIQAIVAALALAALIVSIIVWRTQAKSAREQTQIAREQSAMQARLTAIEVARHAKEVEAMGRAAVVPSFGPDREFVLHNTGQAVARGVEVELRTTSDDAPPDVDLGFILELEDLSADLGPGQKMPFGTAMTLNTPLMVRVVVRWTDEAGRHEESFTLSTRA